MEHKATTIEKTDLWSGTTLQGYVKVSYNTLVKVFGEPHFRNGDKTSVEWAFKDKETGVVFTIYDYKWKSSQNDEIEDFHIGGNSRQAVAIVNKLVKGE